MKSFRSFNRFVFRTPFPKKGMASDEDHRPCLPLKPQEKKFNYLYL